MDKLTITESEEDGILWSRGVGWDIANASGRPVGYIYKNKNGELVFGTVIGFDMDRELTTDNMKQIVEFMEANGG